MSEVYKRIIPCLDIRDGRVVKGVQFESIRDAGNPVELAARYAQEGADELVLLDIAATNEERTTFIPVVEAVAAEVNIPFTVGGGIASVEQAGHLLRAGADKVSVNSAAVLNPVLISDLANRFGSQCVVLAADVRRAATGWHIFTHGGKKDTGFDALDWLERGAELGAGELLITSMDGDGMCAGFDIALYKAVGERVRLPVIASGGAGNATHFQDLFAHTQVTGGLAASIFHYGELAIPELKQQLTGQIRIRL